MNGNMNGMVSLLLIFVIFYFFLIRPQKQQANKRMEMLNALKAGDKIVTIGGICGTVARMTDEKVYIEVAEGVVLEMLRTSISTVETEEDLKDPFAEDEDEDLDDEDIYYDEDEEIIDVDVDDKKEVK